MHALDANIFSFIQTLSAIDMTTPQAVKCEQIGTHMIAYSSLILLHDPVVRTDEIAYERCLTAARLISTFMGHLQEGDVKYLSPFVTVSILSAVLSTPQLSSST